MQSSVAVIGRHGRRKRGVFTSFCDHGIGIHLDKRPFEIHVVDDAFPTFLQRVRGLADQLGGLCDSSFS